MTDIDKKISKIAEELSQKIEEGFSQKNALKLAALGGYKAGLEAARKVYREKK